jgi:hypothetical protein
MGYETKAVKAHYSPANSIMQTLMSHPSISNMDRSLHFSDGLIRGFWMLNYLSSTHILCSISGSMFLLHQERLAPTPKLRECAHSRRSTNSRGRMSTRQNDAKSSSNFLVRASENYPLLDPGAQSSSEAMDT